MSEPNDRVSRPGPWRNWAGDERCRPALRSAPASVEELATAIERARTSGLRVRAVGAGHSFSDIALTDGLMLDMRKMKRVLDVDRASGLVRVQAGITIRELSAAVAAHGLALENLGDIDVQSVAGAISTATHGTGARLRNISSQVTELKLVLADASTLVCSAHSEPELFRAARVGLGALGAIAELTLRCVPAFTLRGVDAPQTLNDVLDGFDVLALGNDHFEFFVFPHADVALTRTNNRTEAPPQPRSRVSAYANDIVLTNHAFGLICRTARRFPSRIPQLNRLVSKLAGSSTRVERSFEIFASPRLVRFTEMEYALPRERTPEAVRAVLALIAREGFQVPFPIEVRAVAPDDAMLSTAAGRESGFVAVHMFEGMRWRPYFHAVAEIMDALGGRPHWGKRHFQNAAGLRPRYPEWDAFQAVRARLDPHGLFTNDWTEPRARARRGARRAGRSRPALAMTNDAHERAYARLELATAGLQPPFALVDLDAMWANAAEMEERAWGKPIRLASKSVRCRELQEQVLARPGYRGTLAFTLPEALWLAAKGSGGEILVAYPSVDGDALASLASSGADVTVMVDGREQLELIDRAAAAFP